MQQMIEGWRARRWSGRTQANICADEASVLLAKLRGLVREWRKPRNFTGSDWYKATYFTNAALRDCSDALEQIIGPEPSGGGQ